MEDMDNWPKYIAFCMDDGVEVEIKISAPHDAYAVLAGEESAGIHRIERDGQVIYPVPTMH